jgi:ABC-type lipoprotein export system ATPase subunit
LRKTYAAGEAPRRGAARTSRSTSSAGEFVALMGPSGCGKSTLLHLCGAMDRPTRRHASSFAGMTGSTGSTTSRLTRVRRERVGFVFQFFNLLPTLTLAENIALPLLLAGVAAREAEPGRAALADAGGHHHRLGHYPQQVSGGEMQRAAIARAVVHRPVAARRRRADRATSIPPTARACMALLAELNGRHGVTILLATHAPDVAAAAHRVVHLRDGRVQRMAVARRAWRRSAKSRAAL